MLNLISGLSGLVSTFKPSMICLIGLTVLLAAFEAWIFHSVRRVAMIDRLRGGKGKKVSIIVKD